MSATQAQMYVTAEQRARIDLDAGAGAEGITMAEVIRRAIDDYLADEPDPTAALKATFGAEPAADAPGRDTWRRRVSPGTSATAAVTTARAPTNDLAPGFRYRGA